LPFHPARLAIARDTRAFSCEREGERALLYEDANFFDLDSLRHPT
jgi:hypothetical protein